MEMYIDEFDICGRILSPANQEQSNDLLTDFIKEDTLSATEEDASSVTEEDVTEEDGSSDSEKDEPSHKGAEVYRFLMKEPDCLAILLENLDKPTRVAFALANKRCARVSFDLLKAPGDWGLNLDERIDVINLLNKDGWFDDLNWCSNCHKFAEKSSDLGEWCDVCVELDENPYSYWERDNNDLKGVSLGQLSTMVAGEDKAGEDKAGEDKADEDKADAKKAVHDN